MAVHRAGGAAKALSWGIFSRDRRSVLIPKGRRSQCNCLSWRYQSGPGWERESGGKKGHCVEARPGSTGGTRAGFWGIRGCQDGSQNEGKAAPVSRRRATGRMVCMAASSWFHGSLLRDVGQIIPPEPPTVIYKMRIGVVPTL